MGQYRFRLHAILRLRRAEEELARGNLLKSTAALAKAKQHRDQEQSRLSDLRSSEEALKRDQFVAEWHRSELVAKSVAEANRSVDSAREEMAAAKALWVQAARSVEVLERLKEKRFAEYKMVLDRREARAIDDLTSAAFIRSASEFSRADHD